MSPLRGRRLVVTRRAEQSGPLVDALERLGATVIVAPTVDVAPPADTQALDAALRRLESFHWVVLTSANACHFLRERMDALGIAATTLRHPVRVAAVGSATTKAFHSHFPQGIVDAQPTGDFRAEGLLRALEPEVMDGRRVLLPVSDHARDVLADGLAARGADVTVAVAYRTVKGGDPAALAEELRRGVDLVLFASPSAVEGFVAAAGPLAASVPAAVIGPVTEEAARAAGLAVPVVAPTSTAEGLVAAILEWAAR